MKKLIKLIALVLCSFCFINNVHAATASITVTSSANQIIVGKNVTVYVTISSSQALGSWEYTLNYNKSIFKLASSDVGLHNVSYVNNNKTKSVTYKYVFTALKSGSSKFYVDSSMVVDFNESIMTVKEGYKTINAWTYTEYQASLSKNNNLSSLSVEGYEITPTFNKDVLEYSVQVNEDEKEVNIKGTLADKKASVSGLGKKEVYAGNNTFDIIVVAENGSEKTYKLNVEVIDKNPIKVQVDNEEMSVVKLASNLTKPNSYTESTVIINEIEVPAFYSEITEFVLVGLKNVNGEVNLYIYDNGNYKKYIELYFGNITLYPLIMDETMKQYSKESITIQDTTIDALTFNKESRFKLIKGMNVETKETGLYLYDKVDNTLVKYDDEYTQSLNEEIEMLLYSTLIFGFTTLIAIIIIIVLSCKKGSKKKKQKEKTLNKKNKKVSKKEAE